MKEVLTIEMQIATRARKYSGEALTNLHEFIDVGLLNVCFDTLNKKGASGVDAEKWIDYNQQRNERIPQLLTAFRSGTYRAPNIRRVFIPKGDGKLRPLGLPITELISELNQKLRGHYAYYGITFNSRRLHAYFMQTKRLLHKWLNHRGGKRVWAWIRS